MTTATGYGYAGLAAVLPLTSAMVTAQLLQLAKNGWYSHGRPMTPWSHLRMTATTSGPAAQSAELAGSSPPRRSPPTNPELIHDPAPIVRAGMLAGLCHRVVIDPADFSRLISRMPSDAQWLAIAITGADSDLVEVRIYTSVAMRGAARTVQLSEATATRELATWLYLRHPNDLLGTIL